MLTLALQQSVAGVTKRKKHHPKLIRR